MCVFNKSYNSTIRHFLLLLMPCPSFLVLIYEIKVTQAWVGVIVHALILALMRLGQADLYEFQTYLAYIVRPRTVKAA